MKLRYFLFLLCLVLSLSADAQTLTPKADFPGSGRFRCFSFMLDGKLYVGGGRLYPAAPPAMADFWVFDPVANTWTQLNDLPFGARSNIRAVVVNGQAYSGLGYDGNGTSPSNLYNDWWQYQPQTDSWVQKADFPGEARYQPTLFASGGKGYVFGGSSQLSSSGPGSDLKDVWEYDDQTDVWTQKADFPGDSRLTAFAAPDTDGGVFIGLGYVSSLTNFFSDVWKYFPATDTWQSLPPLPGITNVPLIDGGCSFYAVYNGKLLLSNVNLAGTIWEDYHSYFVLDISSQTWTAYENANPLGNRDDWAFGIDNSKAYMSLGWDGSTFYTETWELEMADFLTALETANPELAAITVTAANGTLIANLPQEFAQKYAQQGISLVLYTLNGQKAAAYNLSETLICNITHLPSGAYVWTVQAGGKLVKSGRVVR